MNALTMQFFRGKARSIATTAGMSLWQRRQTMRKEEKANKEVEITSHHITPSSRGGDDNPENIAYIVDKYHRRYHKLFSNMTPDEIIIILVECFWNGQWEHVKKAYERRSDDEEKRLAQTK